LFFFLLFLRVYNGEPRISDRNEARLCDDVRVHACVYVGMYRKISVSVQWKSTEK